MIYIKKKKNIYIYALSVFQMSEEAWREEKYPNQKKKKMLQLSIMAAYIQVS